MPSLLDHSDPASGDDRIHTQKQRLSSARLVLAARLPFFGHLVLKLDPRIALPLHNVKTSAITRDGRLYLNVDYAETLTNAQLAGLLCFEVMRPALLFWERQGSRDTCVTLPRGNCVLCGGATPQGCAGCGGSGMASESTRLWSLAHGCGINLIIQKMSQSIVDIALPPGGFLDARYTNWSAEQIYDDLLRQINAPSARASIWEAKSALSYGYDDTRADLGENPHPTSSDSRAIESYWKVAILEAAVVHQSAKNNEGGELPGTLQKFIEEIRSPKIAWRDVLSRWFGENGNAVDFTYRRPSRRSESAGETLATMMRLGVADVIMVIDTSGSMDGRERDIINEGTGICEDLGLVLRVICCDTQIQSDTLDVEEAADFVDNIKGGGGSNFLPVFELLEEEGFEGVVAAFTDGHITVPSVKPGCIRDVLWVIWADSGDVDPTRRSKGGSWGHVIKVDTDGNVYP